MTFQPSARHKRTRWIALFAIVILGTVAVAPSVLAVTVPPMLKDQGGANDQPNQKDLTGQVAFEEAGIFYSAWKWDDTSFSGKNTGDACSLFDTDGDGNANYAVCATVGGGAATELSTRVYSCGDGRPDRCTNPITLIGTELTDSNADWCTISTSTAEFPTTTNTTDLQSLCNITQIVADTDAPDALLTGTLINSCSYPSQEPNSDPSDCVVEVALTTVNVSTLSAGTITWQATLTDTATLTPNTATGSVVFRLYNDNACTSLVWTSAADTTAPFTSGAGGTPVDGNIITNLTIPADTDGVYYWTAEYIPTGLFTGDTSACGEATTITATVVGSAGS